MSLKMLLAIIIEVVALCILVKGQEETETVLNNPSLPTKDSLEARAKVRKGFDLSHVSRFKFDSLPEYVQQISNLERGFLFLGPSGNESEYNFLVANSQIGLTTNCTIVKAKSDIRFGSYNYVLVILKIDNACWFLSRYTPENGVMYQSNNTMIPEQLPRTYCDSSVRSIPTTIISKTPPGSELRLTASGMEQESSTLLWSDVNSTMVYAHTIYVPCVVFASLTNRKLLTTSCNIMLEDPEHDDHQQIHVTLFGAGEVQIITERYVKNDYCNHECSYPVGDSSYVLVTCPNGFQHRLQISESYHKTCPGSGVPYVGWVGTFLCRGSDRPGTFSFLIVWVIFGYIIIQLVVVLLIWLFRLINYLLGKTLSTLDIELGLCPVCNTQYLCKEKVKEHLNCPKGVCPYCKKILSVNSLPKHARECPKYEEAKHICLTKSLNPDTKLKQFISWFEVQTYFTAFTKSMYAIVLLSTFLVVISPVRSEEIGPETTLKTPSGGEMFDDFFYSGTPFVIPEYSEIFDSTFIFNTESELCGKSCWNGPHECRCASDSLKEINGVMFNDELSIVKKELEVIEREMSEGMLDSEGNPNPMSKINSDNGTYMSYDPLTNTTLTTSIRKRRYASSRYPPSTPYGSSNRQSSPDQGNCMDCHVEDNAFIHLTNKAEDFHSDLALYSLEKIQTDWGLISIDSNLQPTYDETNLDVSWETEKKTDRTVTIRGTVIGKLNIGHNSGMTWTVSSHESDEKKKLTMFIYDAVQEYQGNTKFITGSRYLTKWFRGACTGDCPRDCACHEPTCFQKTFDNDRKWSCNPGWCWTFYGGCSCCAVDVEKRLPRWTIMNTELTYLGNNIIFCIKFGSDKLQCSSTRENKKINMKGMQITVSKAYGEINHLPSSINSVFYNKKEGSVQFKQPDYIWVRDDVCTRSCNHGSVGDMKSTLLGEWQVRHLSKSPVKPGEVGLSSAEKRANPQTSEMSWVGMDIEHTCHAGSWPECNYYNLYENIDDQIANVNKTAKHLITDFELRYSSVISSGMAIGVLPRRLTGMIDFTIQMSGVELARKEVKFSATSFKVSSCKGCYGCSSGFECIGSVEVRSIGNYNIHLTSNNPLVSIDQSTRTIVATDRERVNFPIHAISLLNETEIKFCITEDGSCATTNIKLEEPVRKLMKRETIISIKTNDDLNQDKCTGFGWVGCTFKNFKNFFSNILSWFKYLYENLNAIFWSIIPLLIILVGCLVTFKIYKMMKNRGEKKKLRGKGAKYLIDRFKSEEKERLDYENAPKGAMHRLNPLNYMKGGKISE